MKTIRKYSVIDDIWISSLYIYFIHNHLLLQMMFYALEVSN